MDGDPGKVVLFLYSESFYVLFVGLRLWLLNWLSRLMSYGRLLTRQFYPLSVQICIVINVPIISLRRWHRCFTWFEKRRLPTTISDINNIIYLLTDRNSLMLCYIHSVAAISKIVSKKVVRYFATTSNRMSKPKVLVTRGDIPESAINILAEKYCYIWLNK